MNNMQFIIQFMLEIMQTLHHVREVETMATNQFFKICHFGN